jgi:hypothetical protein
VGHCWCRFVTLPFLILATAITGSGVQAQSITSQRTRFSPEGVITVRALDMAGTPIANARVRFSTPSSGWTATFNDAFIYESTSDSNGYATAPYPRADILASYASAGQYSTGYYNITISLLANSNINGLIVGTISAISTNLVVDNCSAGSPGLANFQISLRSPQTLRLSVTGGANSYTSLAAGATLFAGERVIRRLGDGVTVPSEVDIPLDDFAPGNYAFQVRYLGTCLIPAAQSNIVSVVLTPLQVLSVPLHWIVTFLLSIGVVVVVYRGFRGANR